MMVGLNGIVFMNWCLNKVERWLTDFLSFFFLGWIGPDAYPSVHQNGFLLECLIDLDRSLRQVGGRLLVFSGNPLMVLRHIHQFHPIASLCFQKDHEPIWQERNVAVRSMNHFLRGYFRVLPSFSSPPPFVEWGSVMLSLPFLWSSFGASAMLFGWIGTHVGVRFQSHLFWRVCCSFVYFVAHE